MGFMAPVGMAAASAAAGTAASAGVNKGMQAAFGGNVENANQNTVDPGADHRQAVQQLLMSLMKQMQIQQQTSQPAVQMESMNQGMPRMGGFG